MPVSLYQLVKTCPACQTVFTLRGTKLKSWLKSVKLKPNKLGPYCGYMCSSKSNIIHAQQKRAETVLRTS